MFLFSKKNTKEEKSLQAEQTAANAAVKILGSGCAKCSQLETNTKAALQQLSMTDEIGHITDFAQIAAYGVMTTPAIVVDGKVLAYGRVLTVDEIKELLQKVRS